MAVLELILRSFLHPSLSIESLPHTPFAISARLQRAGEGEIDSTFKGLRLASNSWFAVIAKRW